MSVRDVNSFRRRRGRALAAHIQALATELGRPITILDVGGAAPYWNNVSTEHVERVVLLNRPELGTERAPDIVRDGGAEFVSVTGDACDLSDFADGEFDLLHSNSVIEHVGGWERMAAMAGECLRVGRSGWIQTPANAFPVEPHTLVPVSHWFGLPTQAALLRLSPIARVRRLPYAGRRSYVGQIDLLSRRDLTTLFPDADIHVERVVVPKSYTATWGPQQGT